MKLDFSKLNNIGSPTIAFKDDYNYYNIETLADNKTAGDYNIKTPKKYLKIERDKEDSEKARKVYEEYQKNGLKSEKLRSEINKDIYNGVDPYNILLKAIECIGLMTSDTLFYTSNKEKLKDIYGALGHTKAIEQEIQEITIRLEKLKESQEKEPSENIRQAIIRHTQKREELIKILNM